MLSGTLKTRTTAQHIFKEWPHSREASTKRVRWREQRHPLLLIVVSPENSQCFLADIRTRTSLHDFCLSVVIGPAGCHRRPPATSSISSRVSSACLPMLTAAGAGPQSPGPQCSGVWFVPIFMSESLFPPSVVWRVPRVPVTALGSRCHLEGPVATTWAWQELGSRGPGSRQPPTEGDSSL